MPHESGVAGHNLDGSLARRYVHGTNRIDERAILIEGEYPNVDTYYYMLRELDTVVGLVSKNGTLVEAYDYDAYGQVRIWGYRPFDYNRDGDVDTAPAFCCSENDPGPCYPPSDGEVYHCFVDPTHPMSDANMDGVRDGTDEDLLDNALTGSGEPPIRLYVSSVGNSYFFTGRPMHFLEADFDGAPAENHEIQDNRARHYLPNWGRWLQRDPAGYVDGMNLYEYVSSQPTGLTDAFGRDADAGTWSGSLRPAGWYWASILDAEFMPSAAVANSCCKEVQAVQIARSRVDTSGWFTGIYDDQTYHVDTGLWFGGSWSWKASAPSRPMTFMDEPGYMSREFDGGWYGPPSLLRQDFEVCAVCKNGCYKNRKILSCFKWMHGFEHLADIVQPGGTVSSMTYRARRWASIGRPLVGDASGTSNSVNYTNSPWGPTVGTTRRGGSRALAVSRAPSSRT